jgi:hypothetical protein
MKTDKFRGATGGGGMTNDEIRMTNQIAKNQVDGVKRRQTAGFRAAGFVVEVSTLVFDSSFEFRHSNFPPIIPP